MAADEWDDYQYEYDDNQGDTSDSYDDNQQQQDDGETTSYDDYTEPEYQYDQPPEEQYQEPYQQPYQEPQQQQPQGYDWGDSYARGGGYQPSDGGYQQPSAGGYVEREQQRAGVDWGDTYARSFGSDSAYDRRVFAAPQAPVDGPITTWGDGSEMDEKSRRQAQIYRTFRAEGLDAEAARAVVAVTETEGGLFGAANMQDPGGSYGPFQLNAQGELVNFARWLQEKGIPGNPRALADDIDLSARFAAETYMGNTIKRAQAQGIHGADLATFAQRYGQVSIDPWKAGQNYDRLFASGDRFGEALATAQPTAAAREASNARIPPGHYDGDGHDHGVATPYTQQQADRGGNVWTIAFDFDAPYANPFNPAIPRHRGVDLQPTGVPNGGEGLPYIAFRSGRVAAITNDPNGGIGIIVDTGDAAARYDRYFHNNAVSVKQGDVVIAGQTSLGIIGETGTEGFPHLHYEVSQGIDGDPMGRTIDPRPYMGAAPRASARDQGAVAAAATPAAAAAVPPQGTSYTVGGRPATQQQYAQAQEQAVQAKAYNATQREQFLAQLPEGTRTAYTEWEAARTAQGQTVSDIGEFRAHLGRLGAPDPWAQQEQAQARQQQWLSTLPRAVQTALPTWTAARRAAGQDPNDTAAFSAHLDALGVENPFKPRPAPVQPQGRAGADGAQAGSRMVYRIGGREVDEDEYRRAESRQADTRRVYDEYNQRAQAAQQEQAALNRWERQAAAAQVDPEAAASLGPRPDTPNLDTLTYHAQAETGANAITREQGEQLSATRERTALAAEDIWAQADRQRGQAAAAGIGHENALNLRAYNAAADARPTVIPEHIDNTSYQQHLAAGMDPDEAARQATVPAEIRPVMEGTTPDISTSEALGNAAHRGLNSFLTGLYNIPQVAGYYARQPWVIEESQQRIDAIKAAAAAAGEGRRSGQTMFESPLGFGEALAENMPALVTTVVPALLTMGGSLAASGGAVGVRALVPLLVRSGMTASQAGLAVNALAAGGQNREALKDEVASGQISQEAADFAGGVGMMTEILTETALHGLDRSILRGLGLKATREIGHEIAARGLGQIFRRVGGEALGEGYEEAISEVVSLGLDTAFSSEKPTLQDAVERLTSAGTMGAVLGGLTAAPLVGAGALLGSRERAAGGPSSGSVGPDGRPIYRTIAVSPEMITGPDDRAGQLGIGPGPESGPSSGGPRLAAAREQAALGPARALADPTWTSAAQIPGFRGVSSDSPAKILAGEGFSVEAVTPDWSTYAVHQVTPDGKGVRDFTLHLTLASSVGPDGQVSPNVQVAVGPRWTGEVTAPRMETQEDRDRSVRHSEAVMGYLNQHAGLTDAGTNGAITSFEQIASGSLEAAHQGDRVARSSRGAPLGVHTEGAGGGYIEPQGWADHGVVPGTGLTLRAASNLPRAEVAELRDLPATATIARAYAEMIDRVDRRQAGLGAAPPDAARRPLGVTLFGAGPVAVNTGAADRDPVTGVLRRRGEVNFDPAHALMDAVMAAEEDGVGVHDAEFPRYYARTLLEAGIHEPAHDLEYGHAQDHGAAMAAFGESLRAEFPSLVATVRELHTRGQIEQMLETYSRVLAKGALNPAWQREGARHAAAIAARRADAGRYGGGVPDAGATSSPRRGPSDGGVLPGVGRDAGDLQGRPAGEGAPAAAGQPAAGVPDLAPPRTGGPSAMVGREAARASGVPVEMPQDPQFHRAIANTRGVTLDADGLTVDVDRYQSANQMGEDSAREGVFYLPSSRRARNPYRNVSQAGYGGSERISGPTTLRRPYAVRGATGGGAVARAYDQLQGKRGAYETLRQDVLRSIPSRWQNVRPEDRAAAIAEVLRRHGGNPNTAWDILSNHDISNLMPTAITEQIAGAELRRHGYDSLVAYSAFRGSPTISEIFDVREKTYPDESGETELHPQFDRVVALDPKAARPSAMSGRDLAEGRVIQPRTHWPPEIAAQLAADGLTVDPERGLVLPQATVAGTAVEADRRPEGGIAFVPLGTGGGTGSPVTIRNPLILPGGTMAADRGRQLAHVVGLGPEDASSLVQAIQDGLANLAPTSDNVRSLMTALGYGDPSQAPLLVKAARGDTGQGPGSLSDLILSQMLAHEGRSRGYDGLVSGDPASGQPAQVAGFLAPDEHPGRETPQGYRVQDGRPEYQGPQAGGYQVQDGRPVYQGEAAGYAIEDGRPVYRGPSAMTGREPPPPPSVPPHLRGHAVPVAGYAPNTVEGRLEQRLLDLAREQGTNRVEIPKGGLGALEPAFLPSEAAAPIVQRVDRKTGELKTLPNGKPSLTETNYGIAPAMADFRLAIELGRPARRWYGDFSRWIVSQFGPESIDEFRAVFGITSAQADPVTNMATTLNAMRIAREMAAEGILDAAHGDEFHRRMVAERTPSVSKGRVVFNPDGTPKMVSLGSYTGSKSNQIMELYTTGNVDIVSNAKTASYGGNLLSALLNAYDPNTTVDVWMARALNYHSTKWMAGSDQGYRAAHAVFNWLAREEGIPPHEAQAAIWIALKTAWERGGNGVRSAILDGRLGDGLRDAAARDLLRPDFIRGDLNDVVRAPQVADSLARLRPVFDASPSSPGAIVPGVADITYSGKTSGRGAEQEPSRPIHRAQRAALREIAEGQAPTIGLGHIPSSADLGHENGALTWLGIPNRVVETADGLSVQLPGGNLDTARYVAAEIGRRTGATEALIQTPSAEGELLGVAFHAVGDEPLATEQVRAITDALAGSAIPTVIDPSGRYVALLATPSIPDNVYNQARDAVANLGIPDLQQVGYHGYGEVLDASEFGRVIEETGHRFGTPGSPDLPVGSAGGVGAAEGAAAAERGDGPDGAAPGVGPTPAPSAMAGREPQDPDREARLAAAHLATQFKYFLYDGQSPTALAELHQAIAEEVMGLGLGPQAADVMDALFEGVPQRTETEQALAALADEPMPDVEQARALGAQFSRRSYEILANALAAREGGGAASGPSAMAGRAPDPGIPGVTGSRASMTRADAAEDKVVADNKQTIMDSYAGDMGEIVVKEIVQNSVDASREVPGAKTQIAVFMAERRIWAIDQGSGMPRSVVENEFTEYKGTKKPSIYASGGKGTAKSAILGRAQRVELRTIAQVTPTVESALPPLAERATAITFDPYDGTLELSDDGGYSNFHHEEGMAVAELYDILGGPLTEALMTTPAVSGSPHALYGDELELAKAAARTAVPDQTATPQYEETILYGTADDYLRPSAGLNVLSGPVGWVDEAVARGQLGDVLTDPMLTAPWDTERQQRLAAIETRIAEIEAATDPAYARTRAQETEYQALSEEMWDLGRAASGPPRTGTRLSVVVEPSAEWAPLTHSEQGPSPLEGWMNNFIASNQIAGQSVEFVLDGVVYQGQPVSARELATTFVTTIEGPTWDIDIYASDATHEYNGVQVDVQNHGLYQFYTWADLPRAIVLPTRLTANVRSKVGPKEQGYPWSGDRMRLIAGSSEAIKQYVTRDLMGAVLNKERQATEDAIRDAVPLPDGDGKLFNIGRVTGPAKADLDDLARRPYLAVLNRGMTDLHDRLTEMLVGKRWPYGKDAATFQASSFGGFGISGSWQGLNVGVGHATSEYTTPYLLLYDPWNLLTTATMHALEQDMPLVEGPPARAAAPSATPSARPSPRPLEDTDELLAWDPNADVAIRWTDHENGEQRQGTVSPDRLLAEIRYNQSLVDDEARNPGSQDAWNVAYARSLLDAQRAAAQAYLPRLQDYLAARVLVDGEPQEMVDPFHPRVKPRDGSDPSYASYIGFSDVDTLFRGVAYDRQRLADATTDDERGYAQDSLDRIQRLYEFNAAVEERIWEASLAAGNPPTNRNPDGRPLVRVGNAMYGVDQEGLDQLGQALAGATTNLEDARANNPSGSLVEYYEAETARYQEVVDRITRVTGLTPAPVATTAAASRLGGAPEALRAAVESGLPWSDRFVDALSRGFLGTTQHEHGHNSQRGHGETFSSYLGAIAAVTGTPEVRALAREMLDRLDRSGGLRAMAADLDQHSRIISADNVFEKSSVEEKAFDPAEWPVDPSAPRPDEGAVGGLEPVHGALPGGVQPAASALPGGVPEDGRAGRLQPGQHVLDDPAQAALLPHRLPSFPGDVGGVGAAERDGGAYRRALLGGSPTLLAQAAESTAALQEALERALGGDDPNPTPTDRRVLAGHARFYTSTVVGLATNDPERLDTVGLDYEQAREERERAIGLLDRINATGALYEAEAAWATLSPEADPEAPRPSAMAGQTPSGMVEPFYSRLTQVASGLPETISGEPGRTIPAKAQPVRVVRQAATIRPGEAPKPGTPVVVAENGDWIIPGRTVPEKVEPGQTAAEQAMQLVREAGAREDELAWTGLESWIRAQGPGPISRSAILDHLSRRQVRVEETVLGGGNAVEVRVDYPPERQWDPVEEEPQVMEEGHEDDEGNWVEPEYYEPDPETQQRRFTMTASERYGDGEDQREYTVQGNHDSGWTVTDEDGVALSGPDGETVHDSVDDVRQLVEYDAEGLFGGQGVLEGAEGPSLYGPETYPELTLSGEGRETHRELLLRLPVVEETRSVRQIDQEMNEANLRLIAFMGGRPTRDVMPEIINDPEKLRQYAELSMAADTLRQEYERATQGPQVKTFTRSHWDQPNVFAHVRFTERRTTDGKRMVLIEEEQSDWQQKGRKHGFVPAEGLPKGYRIEQRPAPWMDPSLPIGTGDELDPETGEYRNPITLQPGTPEHQAMVDESSRPYVIAPSGTTDGPFENEAQAIEQTRRRVITRDTVPEMPFQRTATWATLGLRRMVRWAAEHGFDQVGWTMGAVHDERYPDPERPKDAFTKFYDQMLVSVAEDLGKPWGVSPTVARIGDASTLPQVRQEGQRWVVEEANGAFVNDFPTREQAEASAAQYAAAASTDLHQVHAMDIPAQMKRSALEEGQPMFMSGRMPSGADEADGGRPLWDDEDLAGMYEGMRPLWDEQDPSDAIDEELLAAIDLEAAGQEIDDPEGLPRTDGPEQIPLVLGPPEGVEPAAPPAAAAPPPGPPGPPGPPVPPAPGVPSLGPPDPEEPNISQFPAWAEGMLTLGSWADLQKLPGTTRSAVDEVLGAVMSGPQADLLNRAEAEMLASAILLQWRRLQRAAAQAQGKESSAWEGAKVIDEARRYSALRGLATLDRSSWPALEEVWRSAPVSQGEGTTLAEYFRARQAAKEAGDSEAISRLQAEGIARAAGLIGGRQRAGTLGIGPTRPAAARAAVRKYGQTLAGAVSGPDVTPSQGARAAAEPDLSVPLLEVLGSMRYNNMLLGPRGILVDYVTNTGMLFGKMMADPFLPEQGGTSPRARAGITIAEYAALGRAVPLMLSRMGQILATGISDLEGETAGTPRSISGRLGQRIENAADEGAAWYGPRMLGLRGGKVAAIGFAESAGRLKSMADVGIKTLAFGMEQTRQAAILAWREGVHPVGSEAWHARVAEIMAGNINPHARTKAEKAAAQVAYQEMLRNSKREAERTTFQGPMGFTGRLMEPLQRHPLGQFVLPFLRTLYHIRGWAIDLSPIGLAATVGDVIRAQPYRAMMKSERGQRALGRTRNLGGLLGGPYAEAYKGARVGPGVADLDRRVLAGMVGSVAFFYLLGLAFEGGLSAGGPPDDPIAWLDDKGPDFDAIDLKTTMQAQGWRPYSVRISPPWLPGRTYWVSYQNWGPLAYLMGAAGTIADSYKYGVSAENKHQGPRSAWRAVAGFQGLVDLARNGDAETFKTARRRAWATFGDLTYLSGIVDLINLTEHAKKWAVAPGPETPSQATHRERREMAQMKAWLSWNVIGSYLPAGGLIRTIAQAQDPSQRATEWGGLRESLAYQVPEPWGPRGLVPDIGLPQSVLADPWGSPSGRREGLAVKHDALGRPIESEYAGAYAWLPFRASAESMDNVALNALVAAEVGAPSPPSEMYYKPDGASSPLRITLPQSVRQHIAAQMGADAAARVMAEMKAVPEAARQADPAAWTARLKAAMKETYFSTNDAMEKDPQVRAALAQLASDSSRTRPFESKKQIEAILGGSAPSGGGGGAAGGTATPRAGATPGPTPRAGATPRPGAAPVVPRTPTDEQRQRAREKAGVK